MDIHCKNICGRVKNCKSSPSNVLQYMVYEIYNPLALSSTLAAHSLNAARVLQPHCSLWAYSFRVINLLQPSARSMAFAQAHSIHYKFHRSLGFEVMYHTSLLVYNCFTATLPPFERKIICDAVNEYYPATIDESTNVQWLVNLLC